MNFDGIDHWDPTYLYYINISIIPVSMHWLTFEMVHIYDISQVL